jgi:hypothetical protein
MTERIHQNGPAEDIAYGADWREAVAKEIAALEASDAAPGDAVLQGAYEAAVERSRQIAHRVWATPDVTDVGRRLRAEITLHALWPTYHNESRWEAVLEGKEYDDGLELGPFDERTVAELVKAVLWSSSPCAKVAAPVQPDDVGEAAVDALVSVAVLADEAKAGITALRMLWKGLKPDEGIVPGDLATSVWFCIDGVEERLDRIAARLDATLEERAAPASERRSGASTPA